MKWFCWGVFALALLGFVRLSGNFGDSRATPEYETKLPAATVSASEQELIAENSRLREQIIQLNSQVMQLKNSATAVVSSQRESDAVRSSGESAEPEKSHILLQELDSFLAGGDSIAALNSSFSSEDVDSLWADAYQRELESFFKSSFVDVFPQYIECRSKRCKITVPVADQHQFNALSRELTENILNQEGAIAKKILIEPQGNDGTLNFFLARNNDVSFLQ